MFVKAFDFLQIRPLIMYTKYMSTYVFPHSDRKKSNTRSMVESNGNLVGYMRIMIICTDKLVPFHLVHFHLKSLTTFKGRLVKINVWLSSCA